MLRLHPIEVESQYWWQQDCKVVDCFDLVRSVFQVWRVRQEEYTLKAWELELRHAWLGVDFHLVGFSCQLLWSTSVLTCESWRVRSVIWYQKITVWHITSWVGLGHTKLDSPCYPKIPFSWLRQDLTIEMWYWSWKQSIGIVVHNRSIQWYK